MALEYPSTLCHVLWMLCLGNWPRYSECCDFSAVKPYWMVLDDAKFCHIVILLFAVWHRSCKLFTTASSKNVWPTQPPIPAECAGSCTFFKRPTNTVECMNVILLHSTHRHVWNTCVLLHDGENKDKIAFVLLFSPPWRWPHEWPKHFYVYCVIKLHSYTQVHLLIFLKNVILLINARTCNIQVPVALSLEYR